MQRANASDTKVIDTSFDGHVHTFLCGHAVGTMEEYVQAAVRKGVRRMSFLEHLEAGIVYFKRNWLEAEHWAAYFREGERLKKVYQGKIEILLGAETGYNPLAVDELRAALHKYPFERVGLSCHYYWHGGEHWNLLSAQTETLDSFVRLHVDAVLKDYCSLLLKAVRELDATVLCHLDAGLRHLPAAADAMRRQRPLVLELLHAVQERGMALEINSSGVDHRGFPYPAGWIVREALALGIPLAAASDAHRPEEVGRHFALLPGFVAAAGEGRSVFA